MPTYRLFHKKNNFNEYTDVTGRTRKAALKTAPPDLDYQVLQEVSPFPHRQPGSLPYCKSCLLYPHVCKCGKDQS